MSPFCHNTAAQYIVLPLWYNDKTDPVRVTQQNCLVSQRSKPRRGHNSAKQIHRVITLLLKDKWGRNSALQNIVRSGGMMGYYGKKRKKKMGDVITHQQCFLVVFVLSPWLGRNFFATTILDNFCLSLTDSCLKKGGENQDEVVDDSLCAQEEQPVTAETCQLPCPAHCVTSEWSQWTKCTVVSLTDGWIDGGADEWIIKCQDGGKLVMMGWLKWSVYCFSKYIAEWI